MSWLFVLPLGKHANPDWAYWMKTLASMNMGTCLMFSLARFMTANIVF
jgi:hypothetical protein